MSRTKRILVWIGGVVFSLCLIFVVLITAFEIAAYSDYGFYEKEYEKYQVLSDVHMEMKDVMYVTREMMSFLKGDRENLIVDTVVDGQQREFFNEREIAHMDDVRELFVAGMDMRSGALVIMLVIVLIAAFAKMDFRKILPKSYQYTSIGFAVLTGGVALLFATNFTKYFTIFHEMFFSNDLWLLDPDTDLLINILPEGFFVDMAARIVIIFVAILLILFAAATAARIVQKKKKIN